VVTNLVKKLDIFCYFIKIHKHEKQANTNRIVYAIQIVWLDSACMNVVMSDAGKHRKHPSGRGNAGGQHHHRINFDK